MRSGARGVVAALVLAFAGPPAWAEKQYKVVIDSQPAGASVRIDDPDSDPVGTTPFRGTLAAGPYMVVMDLEGHEQLIEEIVVKAERKPQRFEFELQPRRYGELVIEGAGGAEVRIDGKPAGTAPATLRLEAGAHEVVVRKAGYRAFEQWVTVPAADTARVVVDLVRDDDQSDDAGSVTRTVARAPAVYSPMVIAGVELGVGYRRWRYDEPRSPTARSFDATSVPMVRGRFEVYPLALHAQPRLHGIGARASIAVGLPPSASTPSEPDLSIGTHWLEIDGGLVVRQSIAAGFGVAAHLGYSMVRFDFDAPASRVDEVPQVDYRSVGGGLDGELQLGPVRGRIGGRYHAVLSSGSLGDRFTDARAMALEAVGEVGYRLTRELDVSLHGRYLGYTHEFTSSAADPVDADGGRDAFITVGARASYGF